MHAALNRLVANFATHSFFATRTALDDLPEPRRAHALHVLNGVARRGGVILSDEVGQLRTAGHAIADIGEGLGLLLSAGLIEAGVGGNSFHLTLAGERHAGP